MHLQGEWGVLLVALVAAVLLQGIQGPCTLDDAYITFRYARNISQGRGFVYNPGQRVLGTTTPLYTLVLALIAWLVSPSVLPWASLLLAIVADTFSVWLMFRLARWIFSDRTVAVIVASVFLLQPLRVNISSGGMETSLFVVCLLLMYECYLVRCRSLSTAVWGALAFLVRPDAVLALFPLFVHWFARDWRRALQAVGLSALLIAPWLVWATWYFGSPIPFSITAKSMAYANPPGHALFFLLTFLATGTVGPYYWLLQLAPGVLAGAVLIGLGIRALVRSRLAALTMVAYPLVYGAVMSWLNPAMYFSWYFLPLIPGLLILMMGGIWCGPRWSRQVRLWGVGTLAFVMVALPAALLVVHPNWPLSRAREAKFWEACAAIQNQVRPQEWIMAPDIGVLGWCLEQVNVLDPVGLVSPEAAPYLHGLAPGQLVTPALVADKHPKYVIALAQFVDPYLVQDLTFRTSYQVIWQEDVRIVDTVQPLYIFQRNDDF